MNERKIKQYVHDKSFYIGCVESQCRIKHLNEYNFQKIEI